MGYMEDIERDLKVVLDEAPDERTIIDFVKNKMLESYRNGQAAKRPTSGFSSARNSRRGFSPSKGRN